MPRDPGRPDSFAPLQPAVIFEVDNYRWLGDGTRDRNWDHDADVFVTACHFKTSILL